MECVDGEGRRNVKGLGWTEVGYSAGSDQREEGSSSKVF